jgi:uncharacterized protein (DUF885 family)
VQAKRIFKWAGGTLAGVLILAGALFVQVWYFRPFIIDIFFERLFVQFALAEPELISELGILRPTGYRGFDDELGDVSPAHTDDVTRLMQRGLKQLHGYDRASLSTAQQLSYDVLDWYLTDEVEGRRWANHNYPVNQFYGVHTDTPDFMVRAHPIEDAVDARNYNERLAAFPKKFAGLMEGLKLREAKGVVPPKFVITRALEQMRGFVATPVQQNILYTNLRDKLAKLTSVPSEEQASLLSDAQTTIEKQVYPAYHEVIAFFERLEKTTPDEYGAWKLPDGDAYYDYLARHHTTAPLTAQAIHELGLAEVARIEKEMDVILREQGLTEGTIGARMAALAEQPRVQYPNDDSGRQQCLADYQRVMNEMIRGLAPAFAAVPRLNVRVERVPAFKEAGSSAAYADAGSLDGSRPGTFYVKLLDMKEQPKFAVRTIAYHEGVPGHLLQGAYANTLTGVPTFRKVVPFTVYHEGWALYAERLAWELGFENDPLDNLGRLQLEMLRAVRLVVDTGIHRKRWTRDQSIEYMVEKTGRARGDAIAEVERYFVLPGQALAYKVGMQRILEMRAAAEERLGNRFDIREFHRVVLANGALPLGTLDAQVKAWVERQSQ